MLKFVEAEENLGDKRELVVQDKVLLDHLNGEAVELFSLRSQEITLTQLLRRLEELLLSQFLLASYKMAK